MLRNILAYAIASIVCVSFSFAQPDPAFLDSLPPEAREWLQTNPIVTVGCERDWAPYDFVDSRGRYQGIAEEYLQIVARRTGLQFEYHIGENWNSLLQMAKDHEVDLLPALYHTPERETYLHYSPPYNRVTNFVFTLAGQNRIDSFESLEGKTVVLVDSYSIVDDMKSQFPAIPIVTKPSIQEALYELITGDADAFIGDINSTGYAINEYSLSGIAAAAHTPFESLDVYMGVRKDLPELHEIICAVLNGLSAAEHHRVKSKWIPFGLAAKITPSIKNVALTPAEKEWLDAHPTIRFTGDPMWLPFEGFTEEGEYTGIANDYLSIIEARLDITFERIPSPSWTRSLEMAMDGEVDVISETVDSLVLHGKFFFADPYLANPLVAIRSQSDIFITDLNAVSDKSIAVIKDYGYLERVFDVYPDIHFQEVDNIEEGLKAISSGRIDTLVCSLALARYTIDKLGMHNLEIAGTLDIEMELTFAVRKDWEIFRNILNKAIHSIDPEESRDILSRWDRNDVVIHRIDYGLIAQIVAGFLLLLAFGLWWNRRLSHEVRARRKAEEELVHARIAAEEANRAKSSFLASMSHEIRTPMNAIIGFSQLLRRDPVLGPEQRENLDIICRSGDHLLNLINDILDMSKIEAGRMQLDESNFDLHRTIQDLEDMFCMRVRGRGLTLLVERRDGLPHYIRGDEKKLRQIIVNLLGNALKFTHEGGVSLRAGFENDGEDREC